MKHKVVKWAKSVVECYNICLKETDCLKLYSVFWVISSNEGSGNPGFLSINYARSHIHFAISSIEN